MVEVQAAIVGVEGFNVAGVSAGLKADSALDFALIVSDRPCTAAGTFTTNLMKAAPVLLDMERLGASKTGYRAIAVNTRCANACTGARGLQNAREMARLTAEALNIAPQQVLVMSTGVIGTQLPMDKIARGVSLAVPALGHDWERAARAIMTTDTRPKQASVKVTLEDGRAFTVAGIAKGAGMIAPNMATMLSVIVTDAALAPQTADRHLKSAVERTFNRIVVDGDMSTNDTVLLLANGASGVLIDSAEEGVFAEALEAVARYLAQAVVRDGEGVTKFITLSVEGAPDDAAARAIGNAIATSPLVKTAFYGADANWGRIVAAAGRAGVSLNPDKVRLWIAAGEEIKRDLLLFENGMPTDYAEADAAAIMAEPSVTVVLDCGAGKGSAIIWTCDLSHDYVSINGHYRS